MRTSELTHRIAIQRATETRGSIGHPVVSWSVLAQVWAKIVWVGGSESYQADREYPNLSCEITIRRSPDTNGVREKDRILVPVGSTRLLEMLSAAETAVDVEDAGIFPPENEFCVRIGSELVVVTARSGSTLTCTRGAFGTTASAHPPDRDIVNLQPLDVEAVLPSRRELRLICRRSEVRVTA